MSMFKKIKGLFIIEEEEQKSSNDLSNDSSSNNASQNESTIQKEKPVTTPVDSSVRTHSSPPPSQEDNPEARKKFLDIFLKAIENNNQDGFDYLEFKNALQNLSSMNMDENTRYQSALAMAKTMNVSNQNIIESAHKYLAILKTEESKFMTVVEKQKAMKVTNAENGLQQKIKDIEAKKQRILELQKEIEQDKASLQQEEQNILVEKNKLQSTYNSFKAAYLSITNQIKNDIEKIKHVN